MVTLEGEKIRRENGQGDSGKRDSFIRIEPARFKGIDLAISHVFDEEGS